MDEHAAIKDFADGGEGGHLSELAVYLDIAKLVLEEDNFVILWELWEEGKNDRSLSSTKKACEDCDRDGHTWNEFPNLALSLNHAHFRCRHRPLPHHLCGFCFSPRPRYRIRPSLSQNC